MIPKNNRQTNKVHERKVAEIVQTLFQVKNHNLCYHVQSHYFISNLVFICRYQLKEFRPPHLFFYFQTEVQTYLKFATEQP